MSHHTSTSEIPPAEGSHSSAATEAENSSIPSVGVVSEYTAIEIPEDEEREEVDILQIPAGADGHHRRPILPLRDDPLNQHGHEYFNAVREAARVNKMMSWCVCLFCCGPMWIVLVYSPAGRYLF